MSRSSQRDAGNIGAKKHPIMHLAAGGIAGVVESALCHPFDTIKTRVSEHESAQDRPYQPQRSLMLFAYAYFAVRLHRAVYHVQP